MTKHTTGIEWTHIPGYRGETWNPIVGCSIVSPGCTNCYAMRFAGLRLDRERGPPHYRGTTQASKAGPVWTGKVALASDKTLHEPLHAKAPRAYFVNSMGDLFHEDVPDEWLDAVFAVMALAPQHIFIVLTKRAERMRDYIVQGDDEHGSYFERLSDAAERLSKSPCAAHIDSVNWPLPNVWLGVSTERQQEADERVPHLLETPAAVRFVSAEPLLGPIDFRKWLIVGPEGGLDYAYSRTQMIDWMIVGGESGPDARPMHPDWARSIRDQCAAGGVPFFFKQWGEWAPNETHPERMFLYRDGIMDVPDHRSADPEVNGECEVAKVGKHRAGRLLDGRMHIAWPLREKAIS